VDIVPISLALAQAATESGWGTSRFVIEGNNLFGEWCYEPGCGLTPLRRDEGRSHEVRSFTRPAQSVESYVRNINTHEKYRSFRLLREQMRKEERELSGLELAGELTQYSERRGAYVEEVREMIRFNNLEDNDG
jgi:Bax protein